MSWTPTWKGIPWNSVTQEQKVEILMAYFRKLGKADANMHYDQTALGHENSAVIYTLSRSAFKGSTSLENRCKVKMVYSNYCLGFWSLNLPGHSPTPFANGTYKVTKAQVKRYVQQNPNGGSILGALANECSKTQEKKEKKKPEKKKKKI